MMARPRAVPSWALVASSPDAKPWSAGPRAAVPRVVEATEATPRPPPSRRKPPSSDGSAGASGGGAPGGGGADRTGGQGAGGDRQQPAGQGAALPGGGHARAGERAADHGQVEGREEEARAGRRQ